jgi:hypothetical protein
VCGLDYLDQDEDNRWVLVNVVPNSWIPQKVVCIFTK